MIVDENEESHGIYESFATPPRMRCKRPLLEKFASIRRFLYARHEVTGHFFLDGPRTIYGFSLGNSVTSLEDFKKITFPMRAWIRNQADVDSVISAYPDVQTELSLIAGRFRMNCRREQGCYFDIRDLNSARVNLGKKYLDEEATTRGSPYTSVPMRDWTLQITGTSADELYEGMTADGGQYDVKRVDLSDAVRLECNKRKGASREYNNLQLKSR